MSAMNSTRPYPRILKGKRIPQNQRAIHRAVTSPDSLGGYVTGLDGGQYRDTEVVSA
jgi:hypothetical protein